MSDSNSKMYNVPLSSDSETEPSQTAPVTGETTTNHVTRVTSLDPDANPDEEEEKQRLAQQVIELQNTLEDLSQRVDSVKEENLKLRSENQVLGQYIENLMSASSVFQSTSPKNKKKNTSRRKERRN